MLRGLSSTIRMDLRPLAGFRSGTIEEDSGGAICSTFAVQQSAKIIHQQDHPQICNGEILRYPSQLSYTTIEVSGTLRRRRPSRNANSMMKAGADTVLPWSCSRA